MIILSTYGQSFSYRVAPGRKVKARDLTHKLSRLAQVADQQGDKATARQLRDTRERRCKGPVLPSFC